MAMNSLSSALDLNQILHSYAKIRLPFPFQTPRLAVIQAVSVSIVPRDEEIRGNSTLPTASSSLVYSSPSDLEPLEASLVQELPDYKLKSTRPYSFKRTLNCWKGFVRRQVKLKDNRKLKHNLTQTFFRGLKDTIKHLENVPKYDFSAKFVGIANRTKADRAAWQLFSQGVRPYVVEVYRHFCSMAHYNRANVSFCQKERMKALENRSALRAYLHYACLVFYDLNSKRLEEKFNVSYTGDNPSEEVWVAIKAYYAFNMLIEEVFISEADLVQIIAEEGLTDRLADAFTQYKSYEG